MWGAFAKGAGVLAIVGDVVTIIDPGDVKSGEATFLRATSGVNLASTIVVLGGDGTVTAIAGALGVEAATVGWVPVAGQAVLIATGVILAGDYLYHNWKPARVVLNAIGHGAVATVHGLETVGKGAVHGRRDGGKAVGRFFKWAF